MKRLLLIVFSIFLVQAVFSQEEYESIDTDRPNIARAFTRALGGFGSLGVAWRIPH